MAIPTQFQTATPYLIVKDCKNFIAFMQALFDATIEEQHLREDDKNKVMHAELKTGNASIMCADCTDEWKIQPAGIFIYVDDADSSYKKAIQNQNNSLL